MAHPSWPQLNSSHPYSYHLGSPMIPVTQPYPPASQARPEQFHIPSGGQPQSDIQILSQELVASQARLLQYTNLISSLYAKLETIRNIVCHNCKERISQETLPQQAAMFAPQVPLATYMELPYNQQTTSVISPHILAGSPVASPSSSQDSHNPSSCQPTSPDPQLTLPCPASPDQPAILAHPAASIAFDISIPSEPTETTPPLPETPSVEETAVTAQTTTGKSQWSVVYNSEVMQVLDISFVHAFRPASSVKAVRFNPDGDLLAAGLIGNLGRAQIYNMETRTIMCALAECSSYPSKKEPPRAILAVCFTPNGRHLVVGGLSAQINIWVIASKRIAAAIKGHTRFVCSLDVSSNGRLLVTASYDGSIRIWNMRDGSSRVLVTKGGLFRMIKFSPNGRYVVAAFGDKSLRIWGVRSGKLVAKWKGHQEDILSVAFSLDGQELISGGRDGTMKSWNVSSLRLAAWSTEKRIEERGVLVPNKRLDFEGHSKAVVAIAISPDGKWVITGSVDKRVCVWDLHTGVRQCTLEGHIDELWAVDFSPVGDYMAAGTRDGFVTLWKYKTV